MTRRGLALPLQPDLLARANAGRNLDIEFLTGRQPDALLHALDRFFQRHRHGDGKIEIDREPARVEFESGAAGAGPRAARPPAPHPVEAFAQSAPAQTRPTA